MVIITNCHVALYVVYLRDDCVYFPDANYNPSGKFYISDLNWKKMSVMNIMKRNKNQTKQKHPNYLKFLLCIYFFKRSLLNVHYSFVFFLNSGSLTNLEASSMHLKIQLTVKMKAQIY